MNFSAWAHPWGYPLHVKTKGNRSHGFQNSIPPPWPLKSARLCERKYLGWSQILLTRSLRCGLLPRAVGVQHALSEYASRVLKIKTMCCSRRECWFEPLPIITRRHAHLCQVEIPKLLIIHAVCWLISGSKFFFMFPCHFDPCFDGFVFCAPESACSIPRGALLPTDLISRSIHSWRAIVARV